MSTTVTTLASVLTVVALGALHTLRKDVSSSGPYTQNVTESYVQEKSNDGLWTWSRKDCPAAQITFTVFENVGFTCDRYSWFRRGTCQDFTINEKTCQDYKFWAGRIGSINTYGNCIRVWQNPHCTGASMVVAPGTGCHSDMSECKVNPSSGSRQTWAGQITSISGCDYEDASKAGQVFSTFSTPSVVLQRNQSPSGGTEIKVSVDNLEFSCIDNETVTAMEVAATMVRINRNEQCLTVSWKKFHPNITKDDLPDWTLPTGGNCSAQGKMESQDNIIIKNCVLPEFEPQVVTEGYFEYVPDPYTLEYMDPTLTFYGEYFDSYSVTYRDGILFRPSYLKEKINKVVIITHGFQGQGNEGWITNLKAAISRVDGSDTLFIIVGWGKGANLWWWQYTQAVANTQVVGEYLGRRLQQLKKELSQDHEVRFHGIGFSLGAHVIGKAGRICSQRVFHRITGLDPAGPSFETTFADKALRKTDAHFVDAIHTDGYSSKSLNTWPHYGTFVPLGDVDFYPNKGYSQPVKWWKRFWNPGSSRDHQRAVDYYLWSISNPNRFLSSTQVTDTPGVDIPPNQFRELDPDVVVEMGYYSKRTVRGKYFISTESDTPWVPDGPRCVRNPDDVQAEVLDCTDLKNPRIVDISLRNGLLQFNVHSSYNVVGRDEWFLQYSTWWNPRTKATLLSEHYIPPPPPGGSVPGRGGNFGSTYCTCENPPACTSSFLNCNRYTNIRPLIADAYKKQEESFHTQTGGLFRSHNNDNKCQKGHLAPNADFPTLHKRRATFLYMNAVPQWKTINNGNWGRLEDYVQRRAVGDMYRIYTLAVGNYRWGGRWDLALSQVVGSHEWDQIPVPLRLVKIVVRFGDNGWNPCANTVTIENDPESNVPFPAPNAEQCPGAPGLDFVRLVERGVYRCVVGIPVDILAELDTILIDNTRLRGIAGSGTCFT